MWPQSGEAGASDAVGHRSSTTHTPPGCGHSSSHAPNSTTSYSPDGFSPAIRQPEARTTCTVRRQSPASSSRLTRCCPACTGLVTLAKRWLEASQQGAVKPGLLQQYLDEFCFRFKPGTHGPGACSSTAYSNRPCRAHLAPTVPSSPSRVAAGGECRFRRPTNGRIVTVRLGRSSIPPGRTPACEDDATSCTDMQRPFLVLLMNNVTSEKVLRFYRAGCLAVTIRLRVTLNVFP